MGDLADRRLLLATARAEFLDGSDPGLRGVPEHVAASWRRSAAEGVHPSVVTSEYTADLDFESRLVRCARPVIDLLAEQIGDVPMCVALTDNRARLLARRDSSSWIGRILDRVQFAQGFDYAEGAVGTNGVGTVLEFGESVHIVGPEHFVDSLQSFACAGAPVRDPFSGRIEGVLDISCLSDHSTPLMHSLVRASAASIEHNLLLDRNLLQQALFDAYSRADARYRQAVIAVGRRTVMANAPMQSMVDAVDLEALQDHLRYLMTRHDEIDDRVDLPSGARVRLRGIAVRVGVDVAGMVAVVTPTEERVHAESGCPAFRTASTSVDEALRAGDGALVLGERGSGRFTLLSALFQGRTLPIESVEIEAAPAVVATRMRVAADAGMLPVLRDLDRVSARAARLLLGAASRPPLVAATATEAPQAPDGLLAWFRSSATVPPLRHRSADLPGLVAAVLADLAPHRDVRLSRTALRLVAGYAWPGNVVQLREALASALRRRPVGVVEAADLPEFLQCAPVDTLRRVDRVERDAIVAALREADGNRVAAAAALGLARSTLYRKIRLYGITD